MKKFTYITLCLLTALSLSACKGDMNEDPNPNPNVPTPLNIGVKSMGATGNADPLDKFETGDEISLFMILAENNAAFTTFEAYNYIYGHAVPVWNPASLDKLLMWPEEPKPLYIYGIHPAPKSTGAITEVKQENGDVTAKFNLPADQSSITIKKYDLMRSENKGTGGMGLLHEIIGASPVSMNFKHKLCKIQFGIVVTKNATTPIPSNTVSLTQIKFDGTQIALQANLKLKNGELQVPSATPSSVVWNGNVEIPISANYYADKTIITDMLIIPFEPTEGQNVLSFTFKYNNGVTDVEKVMSSPIKRHTSSTEISFAENQYNIVKITANITDENIGITADIADWNKEEHAIEPL